MIRRAVPADLDVMKALVRAVDLFPAELLDDMIAPAFAGDAGHRWIVAGGVPQGLAYYTPERMTSGTWNLLLIAVDPAEQGRGVGTALVRHIERELAAEGARVLIVETSGTPDFEATRGFYRARGYDEEARIRDFYDDGVDKIVFRRRVSAA